MTTFPDMAVILQKPKILLMFYVMEYSCWIHCRYIIN